MNQNDEDFKHVMHDILRDAADAGGSLKIILMNYAERFAAAHGAEIARARVEMTRICAACTRARCVHAGEDDCPGADGPDECEHFKPEGGAE